MASNSGEKLFSSNDRSNQGRYIDLKNKVRKNPYDYSNHLEYIQYLQKYGNYEELRHAREQMSKIFPLSPDHWLQWIEDEIKNNTETNKIYAYYERALEDYYSVDVWEQYILFALEKLSDKELIRSLLERSISEVGLDFYEGKRIWERYCEFELKMFQALSKSEEKNNLKSQADLLLSLWRRRFSIPLSRSEDDFKDFIKILEKNLIDCPDKDSYEKLWHKCLVAGELLAAREDNLKSPTDYINYISEELKKGDPSRVINLYKRGIAAFPLEHILWLSYADYMIFEVKDLQGALKVLTSAVRNCTWISSLWIKYLLVLELLGRPQHEIDGKLFPFEPLQSTFRLAQPLLEVFLKGLSAGLATAADYADWWLFRLDQLRRSVDWSLEKDDLLVDQQALALRREMANASSYMDAYFAGSEHGNSINVYCANIESLFFKEPEASRLYWEKVVRNSSCTVHLWLRYIDMEKYCGNSAEKIRNLFRRMARKYGEAAYAHWAQWERENSSLDGYLHVYKLSALKQIHVPSMEEPISSATNLKRQAEHVSVEEDLSGLKRERQAAEDPLKSDKLNEHVNNYYRSVFVSNLQYNTNEEQLKDLFEKCGAVMEVRLVKVNGKLKGYGYIQFLNESSVKKALELDRTLVNRRPIFVSKCVEKEKRQQSRPKFTNEVNKRVIFVKNLPTSLTEECIRKLFSKCGAIREVRMVKHKSGEFKGYLYLEFEREEDAIKSLLLNQTEVEGQTIQVAVSDPKHSIPLSSSALVPRTVGRSRVHLDSHSTVPKDINKREAEVNVNKEGERLSNSDFRKFLK